MFLMISGETGGRRLRKTERERETETGIQRKEKDGGWERWKRRQKRKTCRERAQMDKIPHG